MVKYEKNTIRKLLKIGIDIFEGQKGGKMSYREIDAFVEHLLTAIDAICDQVRWKMEDCVQCMLNECNFDSGKRQEKITRYFPKRNVDKRFGGGLCGDVEGEGNSWVWRIHEIKSECDGLRAEIEVEGRRGNMARLRELSNNIAVLKQRVHSCV